MTYVDLPAPPPSSEGHIGTEELPADHLARLRDSDALLHVVRAFEDPAHPASRRAASTRPATSSGWTSSSSSPTSRWPSGGSSGSSRQRPPRHPGRARGERARGGRPAPAQDRAGGRPPIRDLGLDADEEKAIRGFRFLTQKPVLVLLNVGEADLAAAPEPRRAIAAGYGHRHAMVDALSAKIEMELGELEPDEAAVFMEELGIAESGLDRVIALSYRLLGLISFLTAGPGRGPGLADPGRVDRGGRRRGDPHRPGQGLHPRRDGRATRTSSTLGSMAEARKHGRLRSEGKTYRVRDGDVIEILFSK